MATAAITFVYNESFNLPIWLKHYGSAFGPENTFVVDRGSDDGSTDNLRQVNLIKLPRKEFDEQAKTNFMSSLHRALLNFYDTIVISDCDELLTTDPTHFGSIRDFIDGVDFDYVSAIGIDIVHILNKEAPLDLSTPILAQRQYGRFYSRQCKTLITRVPLSWLPGFHFCDKPPRIDERLFLFHTKLVDYGVAVRRQSVNTTTAWSEQSLGKNYGAHWRFDLEKFVHLSFLVPIDLINRKLVYEFNFSQEIDRINKGVTLDKEGFYRAPMDITKMVTIPDRFRSF